MSECKLERGRTLTGRGDAIVDRCLERFLEEHRPENSLSRSMCVFAKKDADFSRVGLKYTTGFVHKIMFIGNVETRDCAWVGVLESRPHLLSDNQEPALQSRNAFRKYDDVSDDEIAVNYWTGIKSEDPIWEYVAKQAKVIEVPVNSVPVGGDPVANTYRDMMKSNN